MHTLTLNIKDNAYNNILFFLRNLSNDVEILNHTMTEKKSSDKARSKLKGVFRKYADVSKIALEDSISQQYVLEHYKKENY